MARKVERLADSSIRGVMKPGMHPDGDGLYLQVRGASKCWIYRYGSGGRTRYLGLGAYPGVSLASARKARDKAKAKIQAGSDPIVEKRPSPIQSQLPSRSARRWMTTSSPMSKFGVTQSTASNGATPLTPTQSRSWTMRSRRSIPWQSNLC